METKKPEPLVVSVDEAARLLGCSRSSLYLLMKNGELPFVVVAGRRKIRVSALRRVVGEGEAA